MRYSKMFDGQKIKLGYKVSFVSSDGVEIFGFIEKRKFRTKHQKSNKIFRKGSLFFRNSSFNISDYQNLKKLSF